MKNKKGTLSILLYLLVNTPFYDHLYLFPTKLTVCLDNNLNRHFEDNMFEDDIIAILNCI